MRRVSVALEPGGLLTVEALERNVGRNIIHGDRDEEVFRRTVTLSPDAAARLAYELVRERFKGEWSAEETFMNFCAERDIPYDEEESS
jgi:hypothetical protein